MELSSSQRSLLAWVNPSSPWGSQLCLLSPKRWSHFAEPDPEVEEATETPDISSNHHGVHLPDTHCVVTHWEGVNIQAMGP